MMSFNKTQPVDPTGCFKKRMRWRCFHAPDPFLSFNQQDDPASFVEDETQGNGNGQDILDKHVKVTIGCLYSYPVA
jgi:hypothetical protein